MSYQSVTKLNTRSKTELNWWIENLRFSKSQTFSQLKPQTIIKTDILGFKHHRNGQERTLHINKLELLAISAFFLHQREKHESDTQGSLVLPFENGRHKEQTYDQIQQGYLTLIFKLHYVYHSKIPLFSTEYRIRQGIKEETRLFRVASSSLRFSSSFQSRDGYNDAKLEHGSSICISCFQCDFSSAPKSQTGMCSSPESDCTSWDYPAMVPRTFKPLCQ